MNHKASALCENGHTVEWGRCTALVKKWFGRARACGSKGFEQLYDDGRTATVSFDQEAWSAVRCFGCRGIFMSKNCPTCGVRVPVTAFKKKGLYAKLG
ncbi:MAG: hypothetical protein LAQ69_30195 [Acidobacteriia bacterium]|nr:hypothetical protein [Terriglobia bacterium]